jgi:hypothetical protein
MLKSATYRVKTGSEEVDIDCICYPSLGLLLTENSDLPSRCKVEEKFFEAEATLQPVTVFNTKPKTVIQNA